MKQRILISPYQRLTFYYVRSDYCLRIFSQHLIGLQEL